MKLPLVHYSQPVLSYCTTLFVFTLLDDPATPITPPLTPSTPDSPSPQRSDSYQRSPLVERPHCQLLTPPTSAPSPPQHGASCQHSPVMEKQLLPSQPLLKCIQTNLHSLKQEIEESKEECKILKDEALTAFDRGLNRIKNFPKV